MKAQKLGLFLGMNMAVACMVMQGCKAVKPGQDVQSPAYVAPVAETEPAAAPAPVAPAAAPVESTVTVAPIAPAAPVEPVATTTVKPVSATPAPAPKAPVVKPVAAAPATVHVVQKGESLSGISKRYNVKMGAIVAANPGLKPDRIRIGQKLSIPSAAPAVVATLEKEPKVMQAAAPAPVAANTAAPVKTKSAFKAYEGATKEYVVKNGDSLGKIAYENGITIRALKALNGLQKDTVRVGQKLQVPAAKAAAKPAAKVDVKPAPAKKPEAKPAAKPAEKAAAPKAEVKEAAAAAPAAAPAPAAETAPAAPAPAAEAAAPAPAAEAAPAAAPAADPAPAAEAPAAGPTYTVKDGDDIVSVAINWGISPSQLMDLNDLKAGDAIKAGQVLKLPASAKQTVQ